MDIVSDDRLSEVGDRLAAIVFITKHGEKMGVTAHESLIAIDGLAGWANLHLAVVREHGEAA